MFYRRFFLYHGLGFDEICIYVFKSKHSYTVHNVIFGPASVAIPSNIEHFVITIAVSDN